MERKKSLLLIWFLLLGLTCFSQTYILPYDHSHYSQLEKLSADSAKTFHTSIKPWFISQELKSTIDSVDSIPGKVRTTWAGKKLFQEYLIQVRKPDYFLTIDFLPDIWIGKDFGDKKSIWQNSRGLQLQLNIGKKIFISSSYFENQAKFPSYIDAAIRKKRVVLGQGVPLNYQNTDYNNNPDFDFPYATGYISFTPNKYLNLQLGQDKTFIGEGYRSMLLSDVSFNYPFLKANLTVGNVRYMVMWAQMQDPSSAKLSYDIGYRKKWAAFHYLDWNINKRITIGLFESVVWQDADSTAKRGFDFNYLNPVILLRPTEYSLGSPDNALLGLNAKYRIFPKATIYGQFMLDDFKFKEFTAGNGYWKNQYAAQIGLKTYDLFKIANLNMLAEYNIARPYTYSSRSSILNYGHFNESLAHPLGANFKEYIAIINYHFKRLELRSEILAAKYGLDYGGLNFGKDILKPYETHISKYGNTIGQGLNTKLYIADIKAGYLIKPKTNLRLEAGLTLRREKNTQGQLNSKIVSIGIRSSFKNLYFDF